MLYYIKKKKQINVIAKPETLNDKERIETLLSKPNISEIFPNTLNTVKKGMHFVLKSQIPVFLSQKPYETNEKSRNL